MFATIRPIAIFIHGLPSLSTYSEGGLRDETQIRTHTRMTNQFRDVDLNQNTAQKNRNFFTGTPLVLRRFHRVTFMTLLCRPRLSIALEFNGRSRAVIFHSFLFAYNRFHGGGD